jgi:hypothetical protein
VTKLEIDGFYPSEEGSWTSAETHRRFYPTKDPGWCWAETREGKQCCARKGGIRRVGCLTCGTHEKQETAAQTLKAKLEAKGWPRAFQQAVPPE